MTVQYTNNHHDTTNWSDTTPYMALEDGDVLSFTVPGNSGAQLQAIFEYASNSNVFVGYNVTPVLPAPGAINIAGRFQEFKPIKRYVKAGDVLNFITPDTIAYVGVSFRTVQQGN